MHISIKPTTLNKSTVYTYLHNSEVVNKEREILKEAALAEGKPENIVEKMVEGRIRNFFAERCLMEQPFVKDDKQ